ncbi:MAG: DUF3870 domain-containing protein, partial [Bacillota bacterium]
MKNKEILLTGYAKLPSGITAKELYEVVAMALVVDYNTGMILKVDSTLATDVAKDFVKKLTINKNINNIEKIELSFEKYYYGSARNALVSSLKSCKHQYDQIK